MDTETKFLAAFYGTVCFLVAGGTFVMLVGGDLLSIIFIVFALCVSIGILAFGLFGSSSGEDGSGHPTA